MRILFAASDRDLLQSYAKLLTLEGHGVTTAFDGVQVAKLLADSQFDLAIVEEKLPRLGYEQLVPLMRQESLPTILLLDGRVTVKHLLRAALPNAYLPLPFLPGDLRALISNINARLAEKETLRCGDAAVDVPGFRFESSDTGVTEGELEALYALKNSQRLEGKRARTIIAALNEKLRRLGKRTRISYELQKGYSLVNEND